MRARRRTAANRRPAFTLLEVVIIAVVLALMATIAIPRMSRAGNDDAALQTRAGHAALQTAIDIYAEEHAGDRPSLRDLPLALTGYTTTEGSPRTKHDRTPAHIYGPYLDAIPVIETGPARGSASIGDTPLPSVAWVYDERSGAVRPNTGRR